TQPVRTREKYARWSAAHAHDAALLRLHDRRSAARFRQSCSVRCLVLLRAPSASVSGNGDSNSYASARPWPNGHSPGGEPPTECTIEAARRCLGMTPLSPARRFVKPSLAGLGFAFPLAGGC